MKSLDEINKLIARYGFEPFTKEEIREYKMSLSKIMPEEKESFRRLWQRITEMEATDREIGCLSMEES